MNRCLSLSLSVSLSLSLYIYIHVSTMQNNRVGIYVYVHLYAAAGCSSCRAVYATTQEIQEMMGIKKPKVEPPARRPAPAERGGKLLAAAEGGKTPEG